MNAQIVMPKWEGHHNLSPDTPIRIEKSKAYQDLSTICIVPCLEQIPSKVVQNWMSLMTPMNQNFYRVFAVKMEVGYAYSKTIEAILADPNLSKWKYILTLEHDNMPPPDGLLKLYESMDKYDGVGGIYFTKGDGGLPMCYGKPNVEPLNFIPFVPPPETVTQCRGIAMGFSLFKLDIFKNSKLPKPFFETRQQYTEGVGAEMYTQDLKFCENAGKLGYKFAIDSRVKVGHYSLQEDFIY